MRQQLPPALRGWKPPDLLPAATRLPVPAWDYQELEAARAWGYTLRAWLAESPEDRARLVAHELHRSLRQAWEHVQLRAKESGPGASAPPQGTPFDALRKKFFG